MKWLLLFLMAAVLAACSTLPATPPAAILVRPTDSPERLAQIAADTNLQAGQAIYNLRCAHCHGYSGEGQLAATIPRTEQLGLHTVPPHDATGHTWQHPSQFIEEVILNGIQNPLDHYPMPAFAGVITEVEISDLIAYIGLWWTDEQRAWQEQVTVQRAAIEQEFDMSGSKVD